MKKIILTTLSAVAVALCFTACKPEYTTYSGPNYILFSDTLYDMAVVDDETYYEIPVVATRACNYDRNVAVEIIDAGSNAIEGKHYSIESNTVTIKAGELRADVRVRGYHNNIEVEDSLGFKLQLIVPDNVQWDMYGTSANVLVRKACKFDINTFVGPCVVSSTYIMSYMNVDMILTSSEICPDEENTIIIKDYFYKGYDVKVKFEPDDVYNPLIRMDDQVFSPTADAFGTKYGDGYIHVYQPTTYTSYYSGCEKFIFQYMTLYVPGMTPGIKTPASDNTVGTFLNVVEWISEDEAEKLKREGF